MKQLVLTTMITLVGITGAASAHLGSPNHNFHHVKWGLDPHDNGITAATNGGYKSFKERGRACEAIGGRYDGGNAECGIPGNICKGGWKIYTGTAHLPETREDINCDLLGR